MTSLKALTCVLGALAAGALLTPHARAADPITLHALMEDLAETRIIERSCLNSRKRLASRSSSRSWSIPTCTTSW